MNKVFWICFQCFKKTEEKPEEIQSKNEPKAEDLTIIKLPDASNLLNNPEILVQSDALLNPEKKEFKRKKYVRVRSKTSQCDDLDLSQSEQEMSNSSYLNENNPNPKNS